MRLIPILLVVALTASAGCFGKDGGDDGDNPATTTPTGTTPAGTTTPTGATPTTPTTGGNTTTPTKPLPRELCALSFDFQTNTPNPGPPPAPGMTTADCGTVAAGYTTMTLAGNFTSAEPVTVANGITVTVLDAAGTAVMSCAGPGPGPAAVTACSGTGAAVAGGAYTIQYAGEGNVDFAGSIVVS